MEINAVVFDFNGTLLWDTELHNEAWDIFLHRHNISLSSDEKLNVLHGKNNQLLIHELFQGRIDENEALRLIDEKEELYRNISIGHGLELAPGAEDFLNFLLDREIPVNIATASMKENVDFFFDTYNLNRWFDPAKVVYNDGTIRSKPDPQIFLTAMSRIGAAPERTLIIEDSVSGIRAAERAGAAMVIIMDSTGYDYSAFPHEVISDFSWVDRGLFLQDSRTVR